MKWSGRSPKRKLTEEALVLLSNARSSLLTRSAPKRARRGGRILRLGRHDAHSIQSQALLFRYVSIVEAYCDSLMLEMLSEKIPSRTGVVEQIIAEFEESVTSTSHNRREGFQNIHGINLAGLARWAELQAGSQVRDSVAHGLGRLTTKQRRNSKLSAQLKPIAVEVRANSMLLGPDTLDLVYDACKGFIFDLDSRS